MTATVLRLASLFLLLAFLGKPAFFAPVFAPLAGPNAPPVYEAGSLLWLTLLHLRLVFLGTGLATIAGAGLAILLTRPGFLRALALGRTLASGGQTFPPVAVLALCVPLLGFGDGPVLVALFLYGVLPVFEASLGGLASVPAPVMDAARGVGMTGWQRFVGVELALSWRAILSGARISLVVGLGLATIGSTVGARTLGEVIIAGLLSNNLAFVAQGGLVVGLLAVLLSWALGRLGEGSASS